jgi:undecaprenyl-diphosphatase
MQGPAELLPVSSSGHIALVPRLMGWSYADLPPGLRKTFEVALHVGSAPALVLALRGEGARDLWPLALTLPFPAVAGLLFERPIERRLGGVRSVAVAQVAAGLALLAADRRPQRRTRPEAGDHLAAGLAQAVALVPGVSRSGAVLTAARLRGMSREAAWSLALRAALPVTAGAGLLKGSRLMSDGVPDGFEAPLAAGAAAACASALAALPLARRPRWSAIGGYRIALGLGALWTERRRRRKLVPRPLARPS